MVRADTTIAIQGKPLNMGLGAWQRYVLCQLLTYGEIRNPVSEIRGKAARYRVRYNGSLYAMIEKTGVRCRWETRERGARWLVLDYDVPRATA